MDIIRFAITNPVKVSVGVLLIILFGVLALASIPIQMTPDIDRPQISVTTNWVGRSPEEVEKSIIMEQEKKLKTLQGLYKMTSVASLGRSEISLEFNVGYDMTRALQETSNRLGEVPNYPDDVDRPIIRAASAQTDEAIGYAILSATDPQFDVAEFYDYADRYLKPLLERIEGVAQVDMFGGRAHEVQVRFDPVALAQNGVTIDELRQAIAADNLNESAGDMTNSRQDIRFRVTGRFDALEPIRNTIVRYRDGAAIRVSDLATVHLVLAKKVAFNRSRGESTMSIVFRRDSGANVLRVMQGVKKVLAEIQEPGGLLTMYRNDRHGLKVRMVYDDSTYINAAIAVVQQNMYSGGLLAVLVLLCFLRSTRPTLIIAITIPISLVGTFMVMYVTGRNVNVISLTGLCFAVGMVVDNAIVVLENIDRHLHLGKTPFEASCDATREVWGAVLASTLTTVAVFAPVLTIREESGQLFYDIALAICAAVLLSMLVAITVIPAAANILFRKQKPRNEVSTRRRFLKSAFGLVPLFKWMTSFFLVVLDVLTVKSMSGFVVRVLVMAVVSLAAVFGSIALMPPASYLPNGNKNGLFASMLVPPAYSMRQNTTIARRIEEKLRPYWEAENVDAASALGSVVDSRNGQTIACVPPLRDFFMVMRAQGVFIVATSKDDELVSPLEIVLNNVMNTIPGCSGMARQQGLFGGRRGGGNAVQIEVVGNDMTRLREATETIESRLVAEFSRAGVSSDPSNYNISGPERQLVVDQVRAKDLSLTVSNVATASRALIDGVQCGDFDFEGDNIDLILIRDPDLPITPEQIESLPLAVRDNVTSAAMVPLDQLASFRKASASQTIRRVEQERAIQLMVNPPRDVALETAQARILEIVDECRRDGELSSDIRINLTGSADKLSQTRAAMMGRWDGWNAESLVSLLTSRFFLSLLITYLLMSALFENYLYPLVILFSVPFAMVGGFVGLAMVHGAVPSQQLDTLTMLGFIILIGIVVNNAILLIHQTLNLMNGTADVDSAIGVTGEKLGYRLAVHEAVRTRLRPIMMTTLTSVFGMVPLVLAPGAGSELYKGLGSVIVGGLLCSTLFTLVIVPIAFCLTIDLQNVVRWLVGKPQIA
ncbi:MAG: efflux RND transporter permease subunit [Thermoguttaceae bacterium]